MAGSDTQRPHRQSVEEARRMLGDELRAIRAAVGRTTRQMDGYSSGHISNVENGQVLPSKKLVLLYASLGGSHARLISLLLKARAPKTVDPVVAEALQDPRTDPHLLRRGYVVEMVEDTHFFGSARQPIRNLHRATVRFTSTEARFFPFRHTLDEDPRPGVNTVVPVSGCSIAVLEESDDGVIYCVLAVDPDAEDEFGRCTFTWDIEFDTNAPGRPRIDAGTKSRIPLATQRLQFHEDARPETIWWFRGFDTLGASLSDARRNTIALNPANLYTHEFINTEDEWWGLAWTWATNGQQ